MKTTSESIMPSKEILYDLYEKNANYVWIKLNGSKKVLYKKLTTVGDIINKYDIPELQQLTKKKIAFGEVSLWELGKSVQTFFGQEGLILIVIPKGAHIAFGAGNHLKRMQKVQIHSDYPSAIAIGDHTDFSLENIGRKDIAYLIMNA